MRPVFDWFVVSFVLTLGASLALRAEPPATAPIVDAAIEPRSVVVVPYAEVLEPPLSPALADAPHQGWCEPVEPLTCVDDSACPPTSDGTRRVCIRPWYRTGTRTKVCAVTFPSRLVQRWRAERLRVVVDEICERRNGCDPEALHDYLITLAVRETSLRPYKRHRLNPDVEASRTAFTRRREVFADSPAVDEPWRWTGVGLYGQNAALWLDRWDASAVPEALCGEVEATLAHLRAARQRLARLRDGVTCGGEEHHGTAHAGGPSWYDLSLVNSGSEACPGAEGKALRIREAFARSAKRRGLDAYAPVTAAMLGAPVSREEQAAFAARVRVEMPAVP